MLKQKKSFLIFLPFLIAIFLVVTVVCLAIGIKIGRAPLNNKIAEYEKILDYYAPIPDELYAITGKIISIEENLIILEAVSPVEREIPDKEPVMINYKVKINNDTKITKTQININPRKTKITDLILKDLKAGDNVSVRSKENIIKNTELTATLIDLIIFPEI